MSALPHIFKPTLAQVEKTTHGRPGGPLLLFCAAINVEQDMESDERLAAMPGYNPSVEDPASGGDGDGDEQQANVGGGGVKKKACAFRVPLRSIRVKKEGEEEKVKQEQQQQRS